MTEWIITSSALILIVMALRGLLKGKISLRLQYGLWALVLVRLLIPFSFAESAMSVGNVAEDIRRQPVVQQTDSEVRRYESTYDEIVSRYEQMGITVTPAQMRDETREQIYNDTYSAMADAYVQEGVEVPEAALRQEARQQAESISIIAMITDALPYIWYAGMALVGCALLASNLYFYWRLRRSRQRLDMPEIPLRVYRTDYVATPCLFGLVRPGIYLTDEVVQDTQMRNHVLAHELTHHRHRDHIWSILRGVCLMLHWYNPLVWAAAILSKRDAELACDESTIRTLGEKERLAYGRTLIGMTCVKHDPKSLFLTATTMIGSKKTLKERVTLIAKKPKTAIVTLIACVLVIAIAVGCTFTGANVSGPEKDQVWENVLAAVEEYNGRGYYQVICESEYDQSGHDMDYSLTTEYLQHGNNEYSNIASRNENTEYTLRYEGTLYWREEDTDWQSISEYNSVTDLTLAVPTDENLVLSWTENEDGLVVVCDYSYGITTNYAHVDPTETFYIDAEGKLTKYVRHYGVDTENSNDYIRTLTMNIQDPTEATVLLYMGWAYEEVAENLGLNTTEPTEPVTEPTEPAIEPPQPLPTVPDTVQALPENYTLNDLVSSFDEHLAWTNAVYDTLYEYDTNFSMPLIYPFSQDAIAVQGAIQADLLPWLQEQRYNAEHNLSSVYTNVWFEASLNDGVFSLITIQPSDYGNNVNYHAYNFYLATGSLLTTSDMLERYLPGVSYPQFLLAVIEYRNAGFHEQFPGLDLEAELDYDNLDLAGMANTTLYLSHGGALQLCYYYLNPGGQQVFETTVPFPGDDPNWTIPSREDAYEWLFGIDPYQGYELERNMTDYAAILQNAYQAAPEEFSRYLTQAAPEVQDHVERYLRQGSSEPAALPEGYTLADLVASYEEDLSWTEVTDYGTNEYTSTFSMPLIYPFSEDAIAVQQEISNSLLRWLGEQRNAKEFGYGSSYQYIGYEATLNDGLLSLVIEVAWTNSESRTYNVYNLDLETGQRLTPADMVARYLPDLSYPEFLMSAVQLMEETFHEEWGNSSVYELHVLPSENTYALASTQLYLDNDGVLCIRFDRQSLAGAGEYPTVIPFSPEDLDWDAPTRRDAYGWLFSIRTDEDYMRKAHAAMLFQAFYAAPVEFVQHLSWIDLYTDDVIALMGAELQNHDPEAFAQVLTDLRFNGGLSEREHYTLDLLFDIRQTA